MDLKKTSRICLLAAGAALLIYSTSPAAPLMVEKNLFAQDRKAPPPESAVSPNQPARPGMAASNIQLDGVIIRGTNKKAIVRLKNVPGGLKKGQSPFVTVREGQQVGDLRIAKIEPKSISVEKDGQTFTINLFAENKIVTPPAPTPVAAPPQPVPQPAPVGLQPGMQPPGEQPPQNQVGFAQPGRGPAQGFPQQIPPPVPNPPGYQEPGVNQQVPQGAVGPDPGIPEPPQAGGDEEQGGDQ